MNKKLGFTLTELLAVVIILSILTAIAVPQYTRAIQRADAANALISLKTVFDAAKRYKSSYGTWPTSFTGLDTTLLLNAGTTNESGAYVFKFDTADQVSACRFVETAANELYCLTAIFKTAGGKRDVYQCSPKVEKYKALCASLCDVATAPAVNASCTIK